MIIFTFLVLQHFIIISSSYKVLFSCVSTTYIYIKHLNILLQSVSESWGLHCVVLFVFSAACLLSGHHHCHHPVSVGGSSFPMSTMFTHTITLTATPRTHEATLTLSKQTSTSVCKTLRDNILQVGRFIDSFTQLRIAVIKP